MTYCVGIRLDAGLVFLSDSRTNAGLDQISTFRKMMVYEKPGDRFMVMLSAGNLSISQSVREILQVEKIDNGTDTPITIWNATSMFDAVRVLGAAVRRVYDQDGPALKAAGIDFNASMIFGGQIGNEAMRMFLVYSAGNFIEATRETCYFQVGESKYGKPRRSMKPPSVRWCRWTRRSSPTSRWACRLICWCTNKASCRPTRSPASMRTTPTST
jgi:putative proteasome-type protease